MLCILSHPSHKNKDVVKMGPGVRRRWTVQGAFPQGLKPFVIFWLFAARLKSLLKKAVISVWSTPGRFLFA